MANSRLTLTLLAATALVLLVPPVSPASSATCSDYATQAEAQAAADTRDGDRHGLYASPCPAPARRVRRAPAGPNRVPRPSVPRPPCVRPERVQPIGFSQTKYPTSVGTTCARWPREPRILVVNRPSAGARRDRLLADVPTRKGRDRDEYPPAVGRGRDSRALRRGIDPVGWMAQVMYVPSSETRSHGSTLGIKLRRLRNGARFRHFFY